MLSTLICSSKSECSTTAAAPGVFQLVDVADVLAERARGRRPADSSVSVPRYVVDRSIIANRSLRRGASAVLAVGDTGIVRHVVRTTSSDRPRPACASFSSCCGRFGIALDAAWCSAFRCRCTSRAGCDGALESSWNGFLSLRRQRRVVAEERPVAGVHGQLLLIESVHHVVAVSDAVAVGDDEGRPVPRFGFHGRP